MEATRRTGTLLRLFRPEARRRTILLAALALAALAAAAGIYRHYLAPTRIAFVNFRGVQLARLERARGDQAVRIEPLALDALHRAASYPVVYVHGRGLELQETHIEQLREAGRRGSRLFVRGATNPEHDVTNLGGGSSSTSAATSGSGARRTTPGCSTSPAPSSTARRSGRTRCSLPPSGRWTCSSTSTTA